MNYSINIGLVMAFLVNINLHTQTTGYHVTVTPFSSLTRDEFSPVLYGNGIIFCSNHKNNLPIGYGDGQKNLFDIFHVEKKDSLHWKNIKIFSRELVTVYNDGPASFSQDGNTIYFCRNNMIGKKVKDFSDPANTLGIYSAKLIGGEWTSIRAFPYNDSLYSLLTPALTPDGNRIYFASDMPGGYGGSDLYYCDREDSVWTGPVNLGSIINTRGNEAFPFISTYGVLFFASDGHKGLGGKDIYYSQEINGKWINPLHIDADINSPFDDFGVVTDDNFQSGYFSSNRRNTDDIYSFSANKIDFPVCDSMVENNYCFLFYDEYQKYNDTVPVKYVWDLGNGHILNGWKVKYCFEGPGDYTVKLNIIDSIADTLLTQTSYNFKLEGAEQGYINSPVSGITEKTMVFDGFKSNLPNFKVTDYIWDFGEGFTLRGPLIHKVFDKKGEYTVKLGLTGEKDSLGNFDRVCVFKKIRIFDDYRNMAVHTAREIKEYETIYEPDATKLPDVVTCSPTAADKEKDNSRDTYFLPLRIYLTNELTVYEKDKLIKSLSGLSDCKIKINDSGIDLFSETILNRFIAILKDNADFKLLITFHKGNKGSSSFNLEISEKWASIFQAFFSDRRIDGSSVQFVAYGDSHAAEFTHKKDIENPDGLTEFIFMKKSNQQSK